MPEAVFYRRHHRPRMRSGSKPGLHGSAGLARRPTKPSLDYMCGTKAYALSMATLMEETGSEDEGICDFASLAPPAEYVCNQENVELEESPSCASSNWEICSEASDVSSFSLLTVVTNETDSSWVQVGKEANHALTKDCDSYAARLMQARLMKNGVAFQPCKPRQKQHRPIVKKTEQEALPACSHHDTSDENCSQDVFERGWSKKQKGPRSIKARVKIAAQIERRAEQSKRDRLRATQ